MFYLTYLIVGNISIYWAFCTIKPVPSEPKWVSIINVKDQTLTGNQLRLNDYSWGRTIVLHIYQISTALLNSLIISIINVINEFPCTALKLERQARNRNFINSHEHFDIITSYHLICWFWMPDFGPYQLNFLVSLCTSECIFFCCLKSIFFKVLKKANY